MLGFCLNDVAEMQNNLARRPALLAAAFRHLNVVRWALHAREWELHRVQELFTDPDARSVQAGWDVTLREIRALADDVKADGAALALLVLPFRFQVENDAPPAIAQAVLHDFALREGLRTMDLLPVLRRRSADACEDYDHCSPLGADLVARALLDSSLLDAHGIEPECAVRDARARRAVE